MLNALVFSLLLLAPQQTPTVDHSDKRCVVTEVVNEGSRSDCGGWKPAKGEKMIMPPAVNKRLKVGDVFYFVWKETRWVAEIRNTASIQCVVVNLAPEPRLVCNDKDKSELVIPSSEWPAAWYPAHLTGIYNAEIRDGQFNAVETKEPEGQSERIRVRSLAEMRRWRIPPTQQSGRP